jgi:carbonic anhydrase/acetyltransferase-like protein (isoleucine patch superfamily)
VAAGATVDSSVIGTEAVVGEQAVVRDLSVVGVGVVLSPGTRVEGDRVPA